ncbi:MAG: hypothetical protein LBP73_01715 [Clostridiales Family XIII bacterium]|jgi:hypothetical protein|nr:hypothetical protein [Clostridiales Family XIII bacterium]
MGKTSSESKRRWDEAHYAQIKANVDRETAEAFKSACRAEGVSQASVLSDFMKRYAGTVRRQSRGPSIDTRRKRRKELDALISRLERLLAAETASMENTPENLQGTERYEETERIVSAMEDATESLREIYD